MDVRKIPVPILLALGLGEVSCGPCLDVAPEESSQTHTCLSYETTGPCLGVEPTTGPCLDVATTGPCLGVATDEGSSGSETGTGTGTDTGSTDETGTDTGTGTETGTGEDSSTGVTARSEVLERLLERGVLPDDVAARLARPTRKA